MSFAAATCRFAAQSASERRTLSPSTIQRYGGAGAATPVGQPLSVFLSAVRTEREMTDTGFVLLELATLRILKTLGWSPATGDEFVDTATSGRFRIQTKTGDTSPFAAEIVAQCLKLS